MRKKILILLMAVAFAAASLLMPATASAALFDVCHKGDTLSVDPNAFKAHIGHGDEPGACPEA